MTDEEKRQYELARLGLARLMGDASEVDKWAKAVSQTRDAEQRDEAEQGTTPLPKNSASDKPNTDKSGG